ncbi:MAG TPA: alpha/beta hydrolase [Solirubrobacteraceae bacterium]|nr:alpha/beta hydrolase [Solirubrobacteraceae bacterium]
MMYVRELGDGPPVLLLHPGPGLDGTVFLPGVELLARSHRVLLADLPGNGHSPDGDRNEWTLSGFARAVEKLARDLDLRDWTLLGHSFGGFVAMQHLVDFPDSAARIIASCTDASETPPPGEPEDPLAGLGEEERERVAEGLAREQVASSPQQLKDAWMDQAPRLTVSEAALMRMLRDVLFRPEIARPREWGELGALTALAFTDKPVLSIGAELDRAIDPVAARRIAITAPRGELLILDGCGHFPFAEQPQRYWEAVESWLLRTAVGTAA